MSVETLPDRICAAIKDAAALNGRPLIVGITGADASGKSVFATSLERELSARGEDVQLVHVDDFHHQRAHRYGGDLAEHRKYLDQSIDFQALVDSVLSPILHQGELQRTLRHLDIASDQYTVERHYRVSERTVVLVEGVFLLREDIRPFVDLMIFLHASSEQLVRRGMVRDAELLGDDAERRFREKYLPAQAELFSRVPPHEHADIVIDNTDWNTPRVLTWGCS